MAEELTKEEVDRRAEATLRRLIAAPPDPKLEARSITEARPCGGEAESEGARQGLGLRSRT
jgi:hypothetical protein